MRNFICLCITLFGFVQLVAHPNPASECQRLTQQEQDFAEKLSHLHRALFCKHFSLTQRVAAMTLAETSAHVTPDEAVENVLQESSRHTDHKKSPSGQVPPAPCLK